MNHAVRAALAACVTAAACSLLVASPVHAYTPPETNVRIVVTTSEGTLLIALAPENAPEHVKQFMLALEDKNFAGAPVARVSPQFYVQLVGQLGRAQLAGLPVERLKVGNVHGAMSVYDGGKAGDVPTLSFFLVTSHQVDTDYTSIGFVEAGISVLQKMADTPTAGDHQPTKALSIKEIHIASDEEKARLRQAEQVPQPSEGTALLAAVFILAFAAFIGAAISAFRDRLARQWVTSLWLMVALLVFFAIWVAVGASGRNSSLLGILLFGGAIAMFRLMGRFERPVVLTGTSPPAEAPAAEDTASPEPSNA